jgi:hypothetical protein
MSGMSREGQSDHQVLSIAPTKESVGRGDTCAEEEGIPLLRRQRWDATGTRHRRHTILGAQSWGATGMRHKTHSLREK